MKKKTILFMTFLLMILCSCSVIRDRNIPFIPTVDIEKTVHWMVDDAVMAASTQIVYQLRMEISTMIPPTATPTKTYVPPVEFTPTMTSIWQGQHQSEDATPTPQAVNCTNRVKFVEDITIPDGTIVAAGKPFTKTWKLQNVGTCIWNEDYRFEFVDGNLMGANASIPFPNKVYYPDDTIEISVYMTAPETVGNYQGNWKITAPDGTQFGTGENGEKSVWVKIYVR